jgi:phosphorylated CTD-interacting factor 1
LQQIDAQAVRLVWRGHSARLTRAMLLKLRSLFHHTASLTAFNSSARLNETGGDETRADDETGGDETRADDENGGDETRTDDETGGDETRADDETGGVGPPYAPDRLERVFRLSALRLLLRYESIGCAGMHAAIGGGVHGVLRAKLGVRFECCASPLNAFHGAAAYCSAFPDTDAIFGSLGSFSTFAPARGALELNPPFVPGFIDAAADHALRLLSRAAAAGEPLTFVLVLPGWLESLGYAAVARSPHTKRQLLVAAVDHGFVDGATHARPSSYRQSPFDTCIFVCQTEAAASAHPADDQLLAALQRALAECTPTPEAVAAIPMSERARGGQHGRVGRKRRKSHGGGKGKQRG